MKLKIDTVYTSSAVNSTPGCVDWNSRNVICYGSANAVCVYDNSDPNNPTVVQTLEGHNSRVNCVKWLTTECGKVSELISGSDDNTVILWRLENDKFKLVATLNGHSDAVTSVDGIYLRDGSLLIVSGCSDSSVKLWRRQPDEVLKNVTCVQTLSLGYGICLAVKMCLTPNDGPLLALALDNCQVSLFSQNNDSFDKIIDITGHEDWVRGLDFVLDDDGQILLATCSQDTYIRIWSLSLYNDTHSLQDSVRIGNKIVELYGKLWALSLESVLSGHEGWVYSVRWHPSIFNELGTKVQPMKLLSASLDKTMIIWHLESSAYTNNTLLKYVWVENVRVGEVGGNGLGFYGGMFGPNGKSLMGHGYTGSIHMWDFIQETNSWEPAVVCGGHFKEVVDIGWEPEKGLFLVSVSMDQTSRIHAPWIKDKKQSWHEIARPQVHGFDMSALAVISRFKMVSGAEEKVIRAFEAPNNFLRCLKAISKIQYDVESGKELAASASIPSLGLSNKAIYGLNTDHVEPNSSGGHYIPLVSSNDYKVPPTEETLMQNTLWPEIKKMYGHGYEIYALAASRDGCLIASSCKATTQQHAAIILWDAITWIQLQKLQSHQLTVTQLEFSPDNTRLLTVSRDRRFSVFQKNNENIFDLVSSSDKKNGIHSRIIWCCSWTHDSKFFVTGSRDGKIAAWTKSIVTKTDSSLREYICVGVLDMPSKSVTAVAFSTFLFTDNLYLIAAGFEDGQIHLYNFMPNSPASERFQLAVTFNSSCAHGLTIRRLKFRPILNDDILNSDYKMMQLASCGNDHAVKIHNISYITL